MLEIRSGKLYKTTVPLSVALFGEDNKIMERFTLSSGQVLLGLSKPFNREYVHNIYHEELAFPTRQVDQIWSCKFLAEDRVVELHVSRSCTYVQYMKLIQSWLLPLEKTDV